MVDETTTRKAVRTTSVLVALVALAVLIAAAAGAAPVRVEEIPEDQLLDVGIRLFDDGLPKDKKALLELKEAGVYDDVRRAEARWVPVRLMETLQATGRWGAVRIVPAEAKAVDLRVSGVVVESSGMELVVDVRAIDVAGRRWLDKRYKAEADFLAYDLDEALPPDPFQALYDEVAYDLWKARRKLAADELVELRRISELRFAADLAPLVFGDYLGRDKKGRTVVASLPADGAPMTARVAAIRERDELFIDTLTEHYVNFRGRMEGPYESWRRFSYEEEVAQKKLKKKARTRKILGALAIVGGAMADDGSNLGGLAGDAGMIGGLLAIQSGINKGKEAKLHREAIRELAASLDAEMAPVIVEVEGHTLELTGSVEAQYAEWRRLLRDMFLVESGLRIDPNTGEVVEAEPLADPTGN